MSDLNALINLPYINFEELFDSLVGTERDAASVNNKTTQEVLQYLISYYYQGGIYGPSYFSFYLTEDFTQSLDLHDITFVTNPILWTLENIDTFSKDNFTDLRKQKSQLLTQYIKDLNFTPIFCAFLKVGPPLRSTVFYMYNEGLNEN